MLRIFQLLCSSIIIASAAVATPEPSAELFNDVLSQHVDEHGKVAYEEIKKDPASLNGYIRWLSTIDLETMSKDAQLATLINAYNAFTIRLIVDYWPIESIKDIPTKKRWIDRRWKLGNKIVSLDDIEHTMIRPVFERPEIHFALVCAANGCPPLRSVPYSEEDLTHQLRTQVQITHNSPRWYQYDLSSNILKISKIYKWYKKDFTKQSTSIQEFISQYDPLVKRAIQTNRSPKIHYLKYDWSLNKRIPNPTPPSE